ncbi:putative glycosyl hydrolase [Exidia glandulosa HHB12029]|uniref:Putative glycosyl hydrolase n=1 Tax=Exidia glandulosa HHB12029 TaxID=1314781 RepID=A0A165EXP0_EXIGL|nr:putative glycosyl hydrolase [Exidia glandulosa HHB12029]
MAAASGKDCAPKPTPIPATTDAPAATPAPAAVPDFPTAPQGNPIIDGWYADPDTEFYDGQYWIYPTSSYAYDEQTYLDAFSSTDLIHWTKHANILTTQSVTWAKRAVWAPAPVSRGGKYFLYFGANDIQTDDELGGIGVAVADKPEGPYSDAIGQPLIGAYHNGAQPIDQDVFIDDDGQAYIYYGGHGHCNVAKVNEDMVSLGTFDDGDTFKEITPENYVEGAQMFKRGGKYYFMWSEGGWTGPDYAVSYAIADSPLGPFQRLAKILQQDSAVARGSGHNGVINVPGTDIWYIVYHRRPLSETDGNHRQVCYDRMYFNDDGTIQDIVMLVQDDFSDGNMFGWHTYGGDFSVANDRLVAGSSAGGKAMLDTDFGDMVMDADVSITSAASSGNTDAGLIFRASSLGDGADAYEGYYAGISTAGRVVLGKASGGWTQLAQANVSITANEEYHLRVRAVGASIQVFVGDTSSPQINVTDTSFGSGANGVRVFEAAATYGKISVAKA